MEVYPCFISLPKRMASEAYLKVPTVNVPEGGPGFFGPEFSFSGAVPQPEEMGVYSGTDMTSVENSANAVRGYIDVIGFGEPSSDSTRKIADKIRPIGVRTFLRTGEKCSNGAEAWEYVDGIPTGTMFGERFAAAMRDVGYPQLRGLAPGMIEDVQTIVNPIPLLQSVFQSVYPSCVLVKKEVGDGKGSLVDPASGKPYVFNSQDSRITTQENDRWFQTRWIRSKGVSKEAYEKEQKVYCLNGVDKRGADGACPDEGVREGFLAARQPGIHTANDIIIFTGAIAALGWVIAGRARTL